MMPQKLVSFVRVCHSFTPLTSDDIIALARPSTRLSIAARMTAALFILTTVGFGSLHTAYLIQNADDGLVQTTTITARALMWLPTASSTQRNQHCWGPRGTTGIQYKQIRSEVFFEATSPDLSSPHGDIHNSFN